MGRAPEADMMGPDRERRDSDARSGMHAQAIDEDGSDEDDAKRSMSKTSVFGEGHDHHGYGKLIMDFQLWLSGEEKMKTAQEQELQEMAMIIHTYGGDRTTDDDDDDSTKEWVDRSRFDVFMSIVIIVNTVVIGLEVDFGRGGEGGARDWWWWLLEGFFCSVFVAEVVLKIRYHGMKMSGICGGLRWIIKDLWSFITFFIAMLSLLDLAVLKHLGGGGTLRMTSLLRIFGLTRLLRLINRYRALEELRLVLKGLLEAGRTLAWSMVLITMFIYMSAVFVTKQIGQNRESYGMYKQLSGGWDHEYYFGTMSRSMYSLVQIMTLDSWSSQIARHIITKQWYMAGFFIMFLLLTTFGILNIVVSVIVEQMLTSSKKNEKQSRVREERTRRAELEGIKEIFHMSDADHSGDLELEEFLEGSKQPEIALRLRQLEIPVVEAAKLFSVIDGKGTRSLSVSEFISGCTKLKGSAQSKDLLAVQAQADTLARKMDTLEESLNESERMITVLDEVTTRIVERFESAVQGSRRKIARAVGGTKPMVPVGHQKGSQDREVPLNVGNRPLLPLFPDLH